MVYQALLVAAVAFAIGWFFLDSAVSGVIMASALGGAMYVATRKKKER